MGQYAARRFLYLLMVLMVVSAITFFIMHQIPGGPFSTEKKLNPTVLQNLNQKYHLDDPLPTQYADYMVDIFIPRVTSQEKVFSVTDDYLVNINLPVGDDLALRWINFGPSYKSPTLSVNDIVRDHLPVSAQLGVLALLVAMIIGIPLGILAALRKNTTVDYISMSTAILGVSVPVIVLGPTLKYIFAVELGLVPTSGWGEFNQMILPAFALGFAQSALLARLTRASLLQVLNEDYIRTAYAKGLRQRRVVIVHAMKNAMIPVMTIIGPLFAALITGTFVTERVFGIPGLGSYFVTSITNRDYSVIMGTTLIFAFFIVVANFLVDLTYAWLDPRIRLS
ncbi:ABC transporter permease [Aggregatilinea lenta]|uniref:ABC transporter permease n=1 Tax=Aggregatilinea lenta TaxID=913108 RepID=UPI000E5A236B|nr:ABC transporter permease [Aggregatilinea lenta]